MTIEVLLDGTIRLVPVQPSEESAHKAWFFDDGEPIGF
jgi:hypothetical protein